MIVTSTQINHFIPHLNAITPWENVQKGSRQQPYLTSYIFLGKKYSDNFSVDLQD